MLPSAVPLQGLISLIWAPDAVVKELERRLKVADIVLKYQTVRTDEELKRLHKLTAKRERRAARRPRKPTPTPTAAPAAAPPAAPAASEPSPAQA